MRTAHQIAMLNSYVTAECIEVTEYPELARKYEIYLVPKFVINEDVQFEGVVTDAVVVRNVLKAVQKEV